MWPAEEIKRFFQDNSFYLNGQPSSRCVMCKRNLEKETRSTSFSSDRIFINLVNRYNGRHIAKVISDHDSKLFLEQAQEEARRSETFYGEEEGEWQENEEEVVNNKALKADPGLVAFVEEFDPFFDGWNPTLEEYTLFLDNQPARFQPSYKPPTTSITINIVGTLDLKCKDEPPNELCGVVNRPTHDSGKRNFQRGILSCCAIIFDISQDADQVDEARMALETLLFDIMYWPDSNRVRKFILISTTMTWAAPIRKLNPNKPFTEDDFLHRRPHPNYEKHLILEKDVYEAGKKHPNLLKTYVVWSGLTYGCEEGFLHYWFRLAWTNRRLPVFRPGINRVPLIHVQDLARIIASIIHTNESSPKYIFAVEIKSSTLLDIVKAIGIFMGVNTYEFNEFCEDLPDGFLFKKECYDILTTDLYIKSLYITNKYKFGWKSFSSFKNNTAVIIKEYLSERKLEALKIIVLGPPGVKRTKIAKYLSEFYKLEYVEIDEALRSYITDMEKKISDLKRRLNMIPDQESLRVCSSSRTSIQSHHHDYSRKLNSLKYWREEDEELKHHYFWRGEDEDISREPGIITLLGQNDPESCINVSQQTMKKELAFLEDELKNLNLQKIRNGGMFTNDEIARILKNIFENSIPLKKQGYILDGFPETMDQASLLFKHDYNASDKKGSLADDGEHGYTEENNEELGDGEGGELSVAPIHQIFNFLPSIVINLEASTGYMHEQMSTGYSPSSEEALVDQISDFRESSYNSAVLNYFNRLNIEIKNIIVKTAIDCTLSELIKMLGKPRNYEGVGDYETYWDNRTNILCHEKYLKYDAQFKSRQPVTTNSPEFKEIMKRVKGLPKSQFNIYIKKENFGLKPIIQNDTNSIVKNAIKLLTGHGKVKCIEPEQIISHDRLNSKKEAFAQVIKSDELGSQELLAKEAIETEKCTSNNECLRVVIGARKPMYKETITSTTTELKAKFKIVKMSEQVLTSDVANLDDSTPTENVNSRGVCRTCDHNLNEIVVCGKLQSGSSSNHKFVELSSTEDLETGHEEYLTVSSSEDRGFKDIIESRETAESDNSEPGTEISVEGISDIERAFISKASSSEIFPYSKLFGARNIQPMVKCCCHDIITCEKPNSEEYSIGKDNKSEVSIMSAITYNSSSTEGVTQTFATVFSHNLTFDEFLDSKEYSACKLRIEYSDNEMSHGDSKPLGNCNNTRHSFGEHGRKISTEELNEINRDTSNDKNRLNVRSSSNSSNRGGFSDENAGNLNSHKIG